MKIEFRKYDPGKDRDAACRIWREVGWIEKGKEEILDVFLEGCQSWVGTLAGEAEFIVTLASGNLRYLNSLLPFSGVMGVVTSRVARKLGLAQRFTSQAIAESVEMGAVVSGLGVFEQGFYNRLGYGNGGYEHIAYFDPSNLDLKKKFRVPVRFSENDYEKIHRARLSRRKRHGIISFDHPNITLADIKWTKKGFGLGYLDPKNNEITHHLWCSNQGGEHGPYFIKWMTFQDYDQFLELISLIGSFDDQVRLIGMIEPAEIQMQDLLKKPHLYRMITEKSKYASEIRASSWWQVRICNLEKAIKKVHLKIPDFSFNLKLSDPIESYIDTKYQWRGVGGSYIVELGKKSNLRKGENRKLPTLNCSVNAFSRLWLGVKPATGLAVTDQLKAPVSLLEKLNLAFRLPDPKPDWDF